LERGENGVVRLLAGRRRVRPRARPQNESVSSASAAAGFCPPPGRLNEEVIEAVGSEPNYPGGAVGSGGHVAFTFKAKKAGTGEVTLKYWRHFDGDTSITNRFRLRFDTQQ
jgi:hypothetical protein